MSVAEELVTLVAGLVVTTGGPVAVRVVKVLSLPKLVPPRCWLQFGNDKRGLHIKLLMLAADSLKCIPTPTLGRGCEPVAGGRAILEMKSRGQPMWIE